MKLPDELTSQFKELTGSEPRVAVRALYDLQNQLGETYLASDGRQLCLFCRRGGQPFKAILAELSRIKHLSLEPDGTFLSLQLAGLPDVPARLKFTSWDRPELDQLLEFWRRFHPSTPQAVPNLPPAPDTALTPLTAFCAAIRAMIEADGTVDPAELQFLTQAVPYPETIQAGHDYLRQHNLEELLHQLHLRLSEPQKHCLLANAIAVSMVDGLLRSSEQALLDRLNLALGLSREVLKNLLEVNLIKNRFSVFAQHDETATAEPTPLTAFCACLHAMMEADHTVELDEKNFLLSLVHNLDAVNRGIRYLRQQGLDRLLRQLHGVLDKAQRECLAVNLLAAAMSDGLLRTAEQELLDRFRQNLKLDPGRFEQFQQALLTKYDLTVFA